MLSVDFDVRIGDGSAWDHLLARVEMQRREFLDLNDRAGIAAEVCTYDVRLDGEPVGQVRHRYGDGKWPLVRAAIELIEKEGL